MQGLKWLAAAVGAVSALIGAITALMFALGKLPEAYEAVCKFLPCPTQYAWIDSDPVTVSHYIKKETEFQFPSLLRPGQTSSGTWPVEGSRRYLKPPVATCAPAKSDAWKLFDGTLILPNDPLLTQGWTSPLGSVSQSRQTGISSMVSQRPSLAGRQDLQTTIAAQQTPAATSAPMK